jgi:glycosyltransferase involved in cell wall biosynthesis
MGTWEILFVISLALVLLQLFLVAVYSSRRRKDLRADLPRIEKISVIVPFHNEAGRIQKLLDSINRQKGVSNNSALKAEFIFVDDHSTDNTDTFIRRHLKVPFQLIRLNQKLGKKAALHAGILATKNDIILTLDADVGLPAGYFRYLELLPATDMLVLPVSMQEQSLLQMLASVEFGWLQLFTFGSRKPLLCNGANLIFRKSAYLDVYATRTDFDLASGDDVFLLHAFSKSGKDVHRFVDEELSVKTCAPATISELIRQRRRWMSKTRRLGAGTMIIGLFLIALQAVFFFSIFAVAFNSWFMVVVALKILSDLVATQVYGHHDRRGLFPVVVLHQVYYPIYLILLLWPFAKEERWSSSPLPAN